MSIDKKIFTQGNAQVLPEAWKLWPHTFAYAASGKRWLPYRHLKYISERITPSLIRGGGRFIVTLPPRHGKSELISNWTPTWFLHNFPDRKVILASYAAEFATKWGSKVKENLSENPLIKRALAQDSKSKKRFVTRWGGQMISVGVGGPATGEGAHLFIIDDPIKNWKDAMSPVLREDHKNWFRSVATTRLEPKASIVILQTRWHEDDLSGWLIEKGAKEEGLSDHPWEVINMPALADPTQGPDPLGRAPGEALCPERYDEKALASLRVDLGEMIFSPIYQQAPVSMKGNIIHGEWIKFWDELPILDELALFADLTYEAKEENDFTVVEVWGRKGPDIYLVAQIRAQMGFSEQLEAIGRMISLYPMAFHKEIEKKANGAAVIETVKSVFPGVTANNPQTSKEARLASVSPIYKSGNVYYPNPDKNPWVKVNIAEITRFPKATHDDTVDTASMAVAHLGRMSSTISRLEALNKW